ncbi:hypothetical protein DAI22_09g193900 [Oryza sativa Japonica Group]|nr:hypothetical protein DAI22_09g193900 [Oryza sativa Japonica Group]
MMSLSLNNTRSPLSSSFNAEVAPPWSLAALATYTTSRYCPSHPSKSGTTFRPQPQL